ncbi:MAG: VOC family protein [Myxococcota bacterium]|nr:VOC family protein [Myxococcota bacterium]
MSPSMLHVALVVRDYDEAIAWFTEVLDFELVEDTPIPEQGKRWVRVRPRGEGNTVGTDVLLARPSNPGQEAFIGNQTGGRVTFFLGTDDFARDHARLRAHGVRIVREPQMFPYGEVAVFEDLYGNLWDLIGPVRSGDEPSER